MDLPGEIITFYSYKGGTGRSMALANIASLLATQKSARRGVLMIDWDLEAPGLHRYFAGRVKRRFGTPADDAFLKYPGLIDLFQVLREHVERMTEGSEDPPGEAVRKLEQVLKFDDFIIETDIPRLYLLKAGAFVEDYARSVNTFPWEKLYYQAPWLIPLFIDWVTSRFSYVLVDSRTGITDTSGICTMLLPDKLVVVFTPNAQSLDGVLELAERATTYRRKSVARPLSVLPLPSRIEGSEPQQLQEWRKGKEGYQSRFESLFQRVFSLPFCTLSKYFDEVQVQHVSTYAYGEKIAALIELDDNRIGLKRSFMAFLERLIAPNDIWEEAYASVSINVDDGEPLANQASAIYSSLSPEQQEDVRALFLSIVRVVNSAPRLSGERTVSTLPKSQAVIMRLFADKGIFELTSDSLRAVSERLPATWDLLNAWIEADREFVEWHTLLASFLAGWEQAGRPASELLDGRRLTRAELYWKRHRDLLEPSELRYIELSLVARTRRKVIHRRVGAAVGLLLLGVALRLLIPLFQEPKLGRVQDEAQLAGLRADYFKSADEDYFHDIDNGVALSPDEIKGRNTWIVWTGGNDRLWDKMTVASVGALDFVKTLSSHSSLKGNRDNRWDYYGLVNEPCFEKATGPDPNRFGLWLDKRSANCPPDPFENEQKYPGVRYGARGKNIPAGSFYGYATGVVGLRLFPNPDFDEAAQKKWDPVRYYTDPAYYNSKDLVRPYRVGMSCGFCHVGPNPVRPPADRNHPKWENLSSNVGAQFLWADRIFFWSTDLYSFGYQLLRTYRPGTLDTSLVSTDNINNPRSMNAIYQFLSRLLQAKRWGKEMLGSVHDNHQINDYLNTGPLAELYQAPDTVWAPRLEKDGSDSVGVMGALSRWYLSIGTFSEEWLLHFNALVGGKPVSPIEIRVARKNSAYFMASEAQNLGIAEFLVKSTDPHYLKDAPGGDKYLTKDKALLTRGKIVFAENCARCHSSKLPQNAPGLDPTGCAGKDYLGCWNKYWAWTQTEDFKTKMRQIVLADDFLKDNYLSADFRVPVTLLRTNACSALATNAIAGNIWNDFSSRSYRDLPSVGEITWYHPVTGEPHTYKMPAGGRGYTRTPSLVSLWSTAPFLLNNSVGPFSVDPSVDGRMTSFNASIEQLLWPEKRPRDSVLGNKIPGMIDRTTERSFLDISTGSLPTFLSGLFGSGGLEIGPLPAGMPVGLLANFNPSSPDPDPALRAQYDAKASALILQLRNYFRSLPPNATEEQAGVFSKLVDPLLELSKCPDFVVNRGHYFGTDFREPGEPAEARPLGVSDADKRALIEFLKNF